MGLQTHDPNVRRFASRIGQATYNQLRIAQHKYKLLAEWLMRLPAPADFHLAH